MIKSIASYYCHKLDYTKTIPTIAEAGFQGVMLKWQDTPDGQDKKIQLQLANKYKLQIVNMHCDYRQCNTLWQEQSNYHNHLQDLIKVCADNNIPVAVVHLSSSFTPPPPSQRGIDRLQKVVELAEQKNVKLAFENLRLPVFNKYVLSNIHSANVGMCYDCGHDNIYSRNYNVIQYLDCPVFTTHLHDNDGTADTHCAPFLGNVDWQRVINRLAQLDVNEINLENRLDDKEGNLTLEYVKQLYDKACRLQTMLLQAKE